MTTIGWRIVPQAVEGDEIAFNVITVAWDESVPIATRRDTEVETSSRTVWAEDAVSAFRLAEPDAPALTDAQGRVLSASLDPARWPSGSVAIVADSSR